MPAKKKSKAALRSKKTGESGKWEQGIAATTRALRVKAISSSKKIEHLGKRSKAYKALGKFKEQAADIEAIAAIQSAQMQEHNEAYKQARAEREILTGIAQALVDQADLNRIGEIVGKKIQEFFDAEIAGIGLYDSEAGMIHVPYYYEKGKLKEVPPFKYGEGVASHVLKTRKPLYIPTAKEAEKYNVIYTAELPAETMLMTPILSGKKALGILSIQHSQQYAYGKHELELLSAIANSMAVAIENARLFAETNRRNAELAVITSIQTALADELDIQAIYDKVGDKLREIFNVGAITINVYDLEADANSYVYGFEDGRRLQNIVKPIAPHHHFILEQQDEIFLLNTGAKEFFKRFNAKAPQGKLPKSGVTVRLPQKGSQITTVSLMDIEHENAFAQADVRLLKTLANSMSVALENARLFSEIQKSHREVSEALDQQTATSDILRTLASSPTDAKPVLTAVAQQAARLCNADDVQVYRVDGDQLRQVTHFGPLPALKDGEGLPLVPGLVVGKVVLERKAIHLEDASKLSSKEYPESVKLQRRLGHRTTLGVPLLLEGKAIGAIVVRRNVVRPFTEKQISLLKTFADQAAIAIEKARLLNETNRLLEETTQRNAELAVINSVQEGLSRSLKLQEIMDLVGEKVGEIFHADTVFAGLYDETRDWGTHIYYVDGGKRVPVPDGPVIRPSLAAHVADTKKPLLLGTKEEGAKLGAIRVVRRKGEEDRNESVLGVPIMKGERVIGGISVQSYKRNAYTNDDLRLLQTLASSMSVALENARLFDETAQRNAELAVINSVQEGLSRSLNLQDIVDLVGEKVGEIFKADTVSAGLSDVGPNGGAYIYYMDRGQRVVLPSGPPPRPSLAALVMDTKKPLLIGTMEESEKLGAIRNPPREGVPDRNESILFVPILAGENVIGTISVQSYQQNAYDQNDLRLLQTLAGSMSVALENARLFDETAQRNAELAIINSVQEGIASKLDVHAIYELVGEKLGQVFPNADVTVGRYDPQTDFITGEYMIEHGRRIPVGSFKVDGVGFLGELVRNPRTQVVNENVGQVMKEHGSRIIPGTSMPKSFVNVPLVIDGVLHGGLQLQDMNREHAFSASDVRLLETIASSVSVALENARLFDETAQRNAELAVINSVQEGIAKQTDIQGIYEVVGEKIKDIFNAQSLILGAFDHDAGRSIIYYLYEKGKRFNPEPFAFTGLIKHLIATRQTVLINEDMNSKIAEFGMIIHEGTEPAKSGIWVPLVVAGSKAIGFMSLQNVDQEKAFSDSDVRLLETLANGMSVALENARLFDETAQRNAELAVINSVQEAVAKQQDIKGIYEAVGEQIKDIFQAQAVILGAFDLVSGMNHPYYFYEKGKRFYPDPVPFSGLLKELISTRKTIVINTGFMAKVEEYGMTTLAGSDTSKSGVFVPLVAGDKVIGGISLQNIDRENAFTESDVRLLETLANSMSVALENARLFDETAQRNAELSIINAVQEGLASKLEIGSIIDLVGGKLGEIFPDMDAVQVNLYDQENDLIHIPYCVEKGQRHEHESRKPWGIRKIVLASRQAVVNNGPQDDGRLREMAEKFGVGEIVNPLIAGEMPKSVLFVPLLVGDQVRGIISLQNMAHENAFPDSTVQLLSTLANSMSVALENARLFNETERLLEESRKKEEELSTVNTVSQAVASELELASLIELIGVQVRKIFKADIAYLALYDQEKDLIEFPYLFGDDLPPLKMGEGVVSRVIQGGKPILINRDEDWRETEQKLTRVGARALSYLGVPILVGKRPIGAISVQSTQKAGRFDEADQHLLSTIAANVGAAIENARLFAEVARQKEYFETFFQYSPAAVVVVDFDGKVISWNPAAQTLFGYTAQEAIGQDVDSLVANDPRVEAEARMYTKKFTGELGRVEVKGTRTRKDGSLVDVEVKGLPIAVEGKMVGLLVIYHDISEIEGARRAAEEANQAKSAFLANMSHELRTPLNAIIGFTRIVRRKGEAALPEKQLENLDKVLVSAEHLLGLINTILDIAKIEAGRMELQLSDFNLDALVDGCLATTQPLVKPGVPLISSLPPQLSQMHSDEEKIRQVLLNLLSNAAKFTHHGSIRVNGEMKGEMISLAVQDTGIGIAPENLSKIFEEFQQADNTTTREYGGTGLGLSISRSLAKLLGGDLTVASVEGQGSTFTLTLPMHLGPVAAVTSDGKDEIAAPSLDPDKPIVLVIDDQPDMFHILQQNLGDAGYQVVGALSGEEGIEKARRLLPFAITLDIMMPRKDGWQVLYELKNDPETKHIPVIILTIVDNKPMGFRLGASDYLVKPLSEKSVLDALERLARANGGVRPHKLLVVDDDPKVADLVQQTLEGEDFVIETSGDGAQALSHILLSKPDAILLDLLMPRMDGFQFIEELRKHPKLRAIPIIVLTAKSLSNDEQAQLENSVAKIIKKQGLGSETLIKEIHHLFPSAEKA